MANQLSVTVGVAILLDGSSTSFSFDLAKDPYVVTSGDPNGPSANVIGEFENWFIRDGRASRPTGIISSGSLGSINFTASLSGTVVSITFASAPPAGGAELAVFLLF